MKMSRMTEMNIPASKDVESDVVHHKDIGNNIGEILRKEKAQSKEGQKLEKQRSNLDEAKILLKTLDLSDPLEKSKEKAKGIINALYSGKSLEDQYNYLSRKRSTTEVITQCYNIVTSKMEWYEKNLDEFNQEIEGL
jgi:hypothetical protein